MATAASKASGVAADMRLAGVLPSHLQRKSFRRGGGGVAQLCECHTTGVGAIKTLEGYVETFAVEGLKVAHHSLLCARSASTWADAFLQDRQHTQLHTRITANIVYLLSSAPQYKQSSPKFGCFPRREEYFQNEVNNTWWIFTSESFLRWAPTP